MIQLVVIAAACSITSPGALIQGLRLPPGAVELSRYKGEGTGHPGLRFRMPAQAPESTVAEEYYAQEFSGPLWRACAFQVVGWTDSQEVVEGAIRSRLSRGAAWYSSAQKVAVMVGTTVLVSIPRTEGKSNVEQEVTVVAIPIDREPEERLRALGMKCDAESEGERR